MAITAVSSCNKSTSEKHLKRQLVPCRAPPLNAYLSFNRLVDGHAPTAGAADLLIFDAMTYPVPRPLYKPGVVFQYRLISTGCLEAISSGLVVPCLKTRLTAIDHQACASLWPSHLVMNRAVPAVQFKPLFSGSIGSPVKFGHDRVPLLALQ